MDSVLELIGEVSGPTFCSRQVIEYLAATPGPVRLFIASGGGSADHAFAIASALRTHPHDVSAVIEFAGSAATIAAMGAGHRSIYAAGHFLLHSAWSAAVGTADSLARAATRLAEYDQLAARIYAEGTGQSAAVIRGLLAGETVLNAEQCVRFGFAHTIILGHAEPPPDASWTRAAAAVARHAAAPKSPAVEVRQAEGLYHAVTMGGATPPPAVPETSAADRAEVRRRQRELFARTAMKLSRCLDTGATYSPVDPFWRCACGAKNYTLPARDGRPNQCHQCERKNR